MELGYKPWLSWTVASVGATTAEILSGGTTTPGRGFIAINNPSATHALLIWVQPEADATTPIGSDIQASFHYTIPANTTSIIRCGTSTVLGVYATGGTGSPKVTEFIKANV